MHSAFSYLHLDWFIFIILTPFSSTDLSTALDQRRSIWNWQASKGEKPDSSKGITETFEDQFLSYFILFSTCISLSPCFSDTDFYQAHCSVFVIYSSGRCMMNLCVRVLFVSVYGCSLLRNTTVNLRINTSPWLSRSAQQWHFQQAQWETKDLQRAFSFMPGDLLVGNWSKRTSEKPRDVH